MRFIVSTMLAACSLAIAIGSPAFAQTRRHRQPHRRSPRRATIPHAIPFDIPTVDRSAWKKPRRSWLRRKPRPRKRNWKMNIAVVDTNGELVHFSRMEGAQIASGPISIGKARTSARFRRVLHVL